MKARLRQWLNTLSDRFWVLPGIMVLAGCLGAAGLISLDRSGGGPEWLVHASFLYGGGATGARTLLGAVASSTIGVAGTVFSITIAALSLAAGQMGPRLLRNFVRDRGNQFTLGAFLGTFSYTLLVLRSVRTESEGAFIPHLAMLAGVALAFLCVGTLVFFVGHMAGRINVDTVVELVSDDLESAIRRLTTATTPAPPAPDLLWRNAKPIADDRRGYLQELSASDLADWAHENATSLRLLVKPGDYVFPGAPIALIDPPRERALAAIRDATALGAHRISTADIEYALRQLVEVAVRALSPGINDPHTAIAVLDRLGAALCDVARAHLPSGVWRREGRVTLVVPAVSYDGLVDGMFHMIRQNGARSPAVLIRMLEVLSAVASCERRPARLATLRRHAGLVLEDGEREIANRGDLGDLRARYGVFEGVVGAGGKGAAG